MKPYTSIGLSILVLVGVTLGTLLWVRAFNHSVQSYRSPLRDTDLQTQSATTPQTNRIILLLISGLGYDDSFTVTMPTFNRLRQTGANAAIQSIPPTYAQTSWITLISGADSDTNDAPPIDLPVDDLRLLEIDTIFARAHEAQIQTALLGSTHWRKLLPRNQLDFTLFVDNQSPQTDELIYETALPIIKDEKAKLILIQFSQMDFAATYQGGVAGPSYQQAANQIDAYLDEISSVVNFSNTTLIIVSDHGHIAPGGYGGDEVAVIWQPFIMTGEKVVPGSYSDIYQTDLAPTMTTLLGLAPPKAAQGRILFEMLRLSEYDQTLAQLSLAQQRAALATVYLDQITGDWVNQAAELAIDIEQAQAAFDDNNISGAYQLARLAQEEADTQISNVKNSLIRSEQLKRLPLVVFVILAWFMVMWRRRGYHAASIIIAAIITISLYHTLYQLQGYSYSISSIVNFVGLPAEIARRTAVALLVGGGLLLIFLMLMKESHWITLLGTGYGFAVLVTFIFSLPFFWGYWQNGLTPTWYLPEVVPAFWQLTSAFEALTSALLGLILPWPIMILSLFVNFIRRRFSARPSQSDALPGLHL